MELGVPLWELIFAGYSLDVLRHAEEDWPIRATATDELGVLGHCRNLLSLVSMDSLPLCYKRLGDRLASLIESLDDKAVEDEEAILADHTSQLLVLVSDVWMALEREAANRTAFVTLPENEVEVDDLLQDPVHWFGLTFGTVFSPPMSALDDFREAAQCFAVGFAPSAIIFVLRATEDILREYYRIVTNLPPGRKQWRRLMDELRQRHCPPSLIALLDELREQRNEVMHPGRREPDLWGDAAAKLALLKCREAVMRMIRDLKQRARQG